MGSLVGTLSSAPRQEDQNGLPCILLPEEVRLLVEYGIGQLVEYPQFTTLPDFLMEKLNKMRHKNRLRNFRSKYATDKADAIHKLVVEAISADDDKTSKEVLELLNKEVNKIKPFDISQYTFINRGKIIILFLNGLILTIRTYFYRSSLRVKRTSIA